MSAAPAKKSETNVKETVESILVAFILAFIFRAFVVEAFVIPTGSMAPTLLGAHTSYHCPDCGYGFTVNYPTDGDSNNPTVPSIASYRDGNQIRAKAQAVFCPNCGYRLPRVNKEDPGNDATGAPVNYGDRILVMKYVYLVSDPKRWDVIVFKNPDTDNGDYSVNYIKRLAGLPGESLFVLDGDLYTLSAEHRPKNRALAPGDEALFAVQTKPKYAQDALWRIVYDADYVPRSLGAARPVTAVDGTVVKQDAPWRQPWTSPSNAWVNGRDGVDHRTFRFDGNAASGELIFDPYANPNKRGLTDWQAYDVTSNQMYPWARDTYEFDSYGDPNPRAGDDDSNVSDVKLDFYVRRLSGDGPMKVSLTKRDHQFVAELTPSGVTLSMKSGGGAWQQLGQANHAFGDTPTRVTVQNVDYRVAVLIDGKEILATTPRQYAPDIAGLIASDLKREQHPKADVRISAQNQFSEITHLSLWRDVYYTDIHPSGRPVLRATAHRFPDNVMTLNGKEYFPLGDNSAMSKDAREFEFSVDLPHEGITARAGVVPERFLLGKAFFVYWPAGFRPLGEQPPALVPNFGQMRFIQ